jgi:hypothetical protein
VDKRDVLNALPLNTVALGGVLFLRVLCTDKAALHLAPRGTSPPARRTRPAVNPRDQWSMAEGHGPYDGAALVARIWAKRTLCGMYWWQMASQAHEVELAALTASAGLGSYACPRCLREALRTA